MSALDLLPEDQRKRAWRTPLPDWTPPMLATLTEDRFSDSGWLYERKLDGERCLSFGAGTGGTVRLLSRNRKPIDMHYPEIAEALAAQSAPSFVADGEVVAFDGDQTSFAKLQRRMQLRDPEAARRTGVTVFLYLFDLLYVDGHDITAVGLRHRKKLLRTWFRYRGALRYSIHRVGQGEAYWRSACGRGWEGVIAKEADAPYEHGRSRSWLKFKCANEQEFVIGGWTDPKGSRMGLGALLVGYYRGRDLVYAGKVGTGYNVEILGDLSKRLLALEQADPPFASRPLPRTGVHWVRPILVAQIGFTEWTRDGQLRHPRFRGLREDKDASEVVREQPVA
jgi:bifunctional non-homologous end joining protein LigD